MLNPNYNHDEAIELSIKQLQVLKLDKMSERDKAAGEVAVLDNAITTLKRSIIRADN